MVIMYMAAVFKLRIHVIGDDWKDMFNQFVLAPWGFGEVGFAFLRLGAPRALGVVLDSRVHARLRVLQRLQLVSKVRERSV